MAVLIDKSTITKVLDQISVQETIAYMEEAFVAYSSGKAVVPPVGELLFEEPRGEAHIKYGYLKGDPLYCIKIASGFYENPKLGIPSCQGMMLLFSQKTGQAVAILLDDGMLTDIRTAAAGAMVAKYFAPKKLTAVGILGTGTQARLQLEYLKANHNCGIVWVWGRNWENAQKFKSGFGSDYEVHIAKTPEEVAKNCNLIVTTTPSEVPLLFANAIRPGTHITAMGSDTEKKQELDSDVLQRADIVISDSITQSESRGEVFQAIKGGAIAPDKVVELGEAIQNKALQRSNENQISVVDLTGVAVQDIMIAKAVYATYKN